MRITQTQMSRHAIFEIGQAFTRMNEVRLQLSSQKRLLSYGDDPRGAGMVQRYRTLVAANDQMLRNAASATSLLGATDTALQQLAGTVASLRDLVVRETGALANDDTRTAGAAEARGLRDQLLSLANQKVEGSYLFGGHRNRTVPFQLNGGLVTYNGDAGVRLVQVGPTLRVAAGVAGSELMGEGIAALAGVGDLQPRLSGTTALAALNGGSGVALGRIQITDGVGGAALIDLSAAITVQDVLDAINAAGNGVTASISADERSITLAGQGTLAVSEVGGGGTARDLGLLGTSNTNDLTGSDIRAALALSTPLTEIEALDGHVPLGVLRFTIGGTATDVDLSAVTDLAGARAAIQGLLPDIDLRVEGGGVVLVHGAAQAFEVDSPAGDGTAAALGVVGQASPSRLFDVFEAVIAALQANDPVALRQTLVEIEDVHERVLAIDVSVGTRQNLVDQATGILRSRTESLEERRSQVEDVDVADAATRLAFAQVAYEATLASTARLFELSLARYL